MGERKERSPFIGHTFRKKKKRKKLPKAILRASKGSPWRN